MKVKRNTRTPRLVSRTDKGTRASQQLIWHTCKTPGCLNEERAPADVGAVTCGWCTQGTVLKPDELKPPRKSA